jgi:hypothetical protein
MLRRFALLIAGLLLTQASALAADGTVINKGQMLLNSQATCGGDVVVACVTFEPIDPNGPEGCFVTFKDQTGALRLEEMTVRLAPDPDVGGQTSLEGTSASLYVKATVLGHGYYVPSWTHEQTGKCSTGYHPSGISVGN